MCLIVILLIIVVYDGEVNYIFLMLLGKVFDLVDGFELLFMIMKICEFIFYNFDVFLIICLFLIL